MQAQRVPGTWRLQALNKIKAELAVLTAEQARLEREVRERAAQRASFAADFEAARGELAAAQALVRRLTLEQQDTDQPKILDYIRLKHDNMVRYLVVQLCMAATAR